MTESRYWYLAGPYAHPSAEVRELRFRALNAVAARLMQMGMHIFSPISHGHTIAASADLGWSHQDWLDFDFPFVYNARGLLVAELPNWHNSKGVAMEIGFARQHDKPVIYLPETRLWVERLLGPEAWEALKA